MRFPQIKSPLSVGADVGGTRLEDGGPSFSPEYSGRAVEVKAACVFRKFFKSVRLRRGIRVFCRLSGDTIKPDHYCDFFEEPGAA